MIKHFQFHSCFAVALLVFCLFPIIVHAQANGTKRPILIGGKTPRQILALLDYKGVLGLTDRQWNSYRWVFARLDANQDGRHSKQEYIVNGVHMNQQARQGIFRASDSNQDGYVTEAEYIENRMITDEAKLIFEAMDANRNGKLTRAEFMASKQIKHLKLAQTVFKALDVNSNGELVIPEYLRVWGQWARQ